MLFWTKGRVRVYALFVVVTIVAGTGLAVLVLAGAVPDSVTLRAMVSGCVVLALGTLTVRVGVDVVVATQEPGDPPPPTGG